MANPSELTLLEQQILLAIMRLHPNAYGVSIRNEIKKRTGKDYSLGAIYAALERLEGYGMIASREGEPTAARGGRKKLYFTITGVGQSALQAALHAMDAMRAGVKLKGAVGMSKNDWTLFSEMLKVCLEHSKGMLEMEILEKNYNKSSWAYALRTTIINQRRPPRIDG